MGLRRGSGSSSSKVHSGKPGNGKDQISERVKALSNAKWKEQIEVALGFKSYHEMQISINREFGRSFV